MVCQIRWRVSTLASHLYAAAVAGWDGPLLEPSIRDDLQRCIQRLGELGFTSQQLLEQAVPLAADANTISDLVRRWKESDLLPTVGSADWELVANVLESVLDRLTRRRPSEHVELNLRMRPLREQWEARGPGLLAAVGRHLPCGELPQLMDVQLVRPVLGGGGVAHPNFDSVTLEAVLVNPVAELPEVVRLGWLFTQLGVAHGWPTDLIRGEASPIALVALPVILTAAAELELVEFSQGTVARSLATWQPRAWESNELAQRLTKWWQESASRVASSPDDWREAVKGLLAAL